MIFTESKNFIRPALLLGVLVVFLLGNVALAQNRQELPPPPPPPRYRPKPTPTPTPPRDEDIEVLRINSNLVMAPVSVLDSNGNPVHDLQVKDFRLQEQGKQQEIAQIGNPDEVPLEIALLIDVSGSTNARFIFEKEAAASFLKQVMKPSDRATIFMIDRAAVLKMTNAKVDEASTGLRAIEPATDKGPTAFFDTVLEAAQYLANTPAQHRRVILTISDGVDNFSEKIKKAIGATRAEQDAVGLAARQHINDRALTEVQREVQRADAVFYSINPAGETMHLNVLTKRGQEGMLQLAVATGGNAFVPERSEDLEPVFRQIAAELRGQYLLQYYSNSQTPGEFRRIAVTVPTRPDVRIRARQGYYPKGK